MVFKISRNLILGTCWKNVVQIAPMLRCCCNFITATCCLLPVQKENNVTSPYGSKEISGIGFVNIVLFLLKNFHIERFCVRCGMWLKIGIESQLQFEVGLPAIPSHISRIEHLYLENVNKCLVSNKLNPIQSKSKVLNCFVVVWSLSRPQVFTNLTTA